GATAGGTTNQTTTGAGSDRALPWWRGAVGYEIYVRSFQDSNGDGTGDLAGITSRLGHLADLGIDVVWITPFFPSPGKDHGYDVSDYCDVDPQFGTLADFDALIAAAHARGIRVLADIVPNHSSDQHPWFQAAIADVASPYRDYYHFRPAAPDGGPPNNWVANFGGSAWSPDPAGTGMYYLHLFLPEQPDLNWTNPAVMDEFLAILRFWCDRGVDGFRIDVAHGLTKDPEFHDNIQLRPVTADMHPAAVYWSFEHVNDSNRPETAEIFRRWHAEVAPYGAVLFGEIGTPDPAGVAHAVAQHDALDGGFILRISAMKWDPAKIVDKLVAFNEASRGGAVWALSNHDISRAVSRFGAATVGQQRAVDRVVTVTTLLIALDGI
ncbi:MAG TPA: alpha-amylase family glycosyl hydrolase, partial [Ilumatobacteraceae bacterium]|nr:alpha-amylase family glycosyl hydrolase [Ilumatobacteraceae bacterium]